MKTSRTFIKVNSACIFLLISVIQLFFSCGKKALKNDIEFAEVNLKSDSGNLNLFIARTEVTQAQYLEVMGQNPSVIKNDELPVTNITYEQACSYCNKLNKKLGFKETYKITKSGNSYSVKLIDNAPGLRLLKFSEAKTIYETVYIKENGDTEESLYFNSPAPSDSWHGNRLHKTAHSKPNSLGLFDFAGNAYEYVSCPEMLCSDKIEKRSLPYILYGQNLLGIHTKESLKAAVGKDAMEKYFNDICISEDDAISFRICAPQNVDKSKLNIIYEKNIEKALKKWEQDSLEKIFSKFEFVHCDEYSYQTDGEKPDRTKKQITIHVPELNVSKTEITKDFFDFIQNGKLYDDIEEKDYSDFYYSYCYYNGYQLEDFVIDNSVKRNMTYETALQFCNKLSELKNLTPCYEITDQGIVFNPAANGYRLPTKAEFISFDAQYNSNDEIKFDSTYWDISTDTYTTQLFTTDMYEPVTTYPGNRLIGRWTGKNKKPIFIEMQNKYVTEFREPESPNFCLRLFQTADTKQVESYRKKQDEAVLAEIKKEFANIVEMEFCEGGLKKFNNSIELPDAELADYELSKKEITPYIYKTITGKFSSSDDSSLKDRCYLMYYDAVEMLNRLSRLLGLEECYVKNGSHWECDYTKNGYRLPTLAEFANKNSLDVCSEVQFNDLCVTNHIIAWETSFPHGIDYIEGEKIYHTAYSSWSDGLHQDEYNSIYLCRTKDSAKMKELLKKNKEEKKLLASQIDKKLRMTSLPGAKYTMTYYDSNTEKEVAKSSTLKPFYIQQSKFDTELLKHVNRYDRDKKYTPYAELSFINTLITCNKLSLAANLTPCYRINGKFFPEDLSDDLHIEWYENSGKKPAFDYTIEYDKNADGYQLCSEIEWDYAGSLNTNPDDFYLIKKLSGNDSIEFKEGVIYLMNTTCEEWCYDRGPDLEYEEEGQFRNSDPKHYAYETRVTRTHCGNDSQTREEKRRYCPLYQSNTFRVIRYQ
ncbi:MAG: SUMF1/EgtB/PvdO family nonheme iron enzyme [Treponema sp.]|uniref:formylglycine-generating enzyme family protein n=1 Tax=Treponema sp. TaxID=166 RepID=UPI00298EB5F4|nr:SUMF1/EgtB/PvdO family nonheme iron enzyme [Treponema sp.]MBR5933694.1 SUMF1/EgtB/PvdO family nonheme iron enzyme [Treponema sp.]